MRLVPVTCTHLDQIRDVTPNTDGCEEGLKNRHATKFHATEHPLIQSDEAGEDWLWCCVDELWMEPA